MGMKAVVRKVMNESDTRKSMADFEDASKSYMGWPLHFLATLLWRLISEFYRLIPRKRTQGIKEKLVEEVHQQPPVRLKNLPQSDEYFVNKRGRAMHVRSYLPPPSADVLSIQAVILFAHGYGSHCNSPRKHQMGLAMPQQGLCMYQMDLEGHGYSGGERAYIEDYHHWVDDFRQLLELVAGDGSDAPRDAHHGASAIAPHNFIATPAQRKRLREVPIFIAGESLGGALSILLGLSLHETNHPLLPRFKGEVLLAPAIKGNPPAKMLVATLRHLVVPLIPRWQIPTCLESVNRPDMCVLELDERRHATHDVLGFPGGLGWGGNMRFRTGLNLIDLTAEVSERLEHVKFPFLIMHDPGDGIVQYGSSKELTSRASTPQGSPRGRELRPMDGWLHCLLTNCPEITIQHMQDWVLYQTGLHEDRHHQPGPALHRKSVSDLSRGVPIRKSLSMSGVSTEVAARDAVESALMSRGVSGSGSGNGSGVGSISGRVCSGGIVSNVAPRGFSGERCVRDSCDGGNGVIHFRGSYEGRSRTMTSNPGDAGGRHAAACSGTPGAVRWSTGSGLSCTGCNREVREFSNSSNSSAGSGTIVTEVGSVGAVTPPLSSPSERVLFGVSSKIHDGIEVERTAGGETGTGDAGADLHIASPSSVLNSLGAMSEEERSA